MILNRALILKKVEYIDHVILSAGTAKRIAVPSGKLVVGFGNNADFYAKAGDASVEAAIPSSDVLDGSGSYFNPIGFVMSENDTHISLISPVDAIITLYFLSDRD